MSNVIPFPRHHRDRIEVLAGIDAATGKATYLCDLVTAEGRMIIADYPNLSATCAAMGPWIEDGVDVVLIGGAA